MNKLKGFLKKPISLLALGLIASFFAACASTGLVPGNVMPLGSGTDISAQGALGGIEAVSQGPLFTGDGGQDIRLAVLAPEIQGEVPAYLPVYVQGLLNNNFRKYSAIDLIDRQNLDRIIKEQDMAASGRFSDQDFIAIGNLANARYLLLGTIQKISGERYSLQLSISESATSILSASFMMDGSLAQLEGRGTLINEATADLLSQMGVVLTETGRRTLLAGNSSVVRAEAGMARGITAQAGGDEVQALFNITQAITFDPSNLEALSRLNALSSSISGGSVSQRIVNEIQAYYDWLDVFKETAQFFNEHPPFEITFDPNLIQIGITDYKTNTANIGMRIALDPSEAGFAALNALLEGLEKTGKREDWGCSGWPLLDITPKTAGTVVFDGKRSFSYKVDVELLNENNKNLGNSSITLTTEAIKFSAGDKSVKAPGGTMETIRFSKLRAEDLTPTMTIVIVAVNGIPSRDLNASGYMKIDTGNLENRQTETEKKELAEDARLREREQEAAEKRAQQARDAAARKASRDAFLKQKSVDANRNDLEIFNLDILWGGDGIWGANIFIGGNYSFVPFTSIGVRIKGGYFSEKDEDNEGTGFPTKEGTQGLLTGSVSPSLGLVFPFSANTKIFADALLELGYFGRKGLINDRITPCFDVGLLYCEGSSAINIKYQGTWYDGFFTNSVGVGLSFRWDGF